MSRSPAGAAGKGPACLMAGKTKCGWASSIPLMQKGSRQSSRAEADSIPAVQAQCLPDLRRLGGV